MIENPVFRHEILGRMRLRRRSMAAAASVFTVLLLIGIVYWAIIEMVFSFTESDSGAVAYRMAAAVQIALLTLISPAMAANSVSREREQQTWEMLICSLLRPREIVLGKLAARLCLLAIVIALFAPAEAFGWFYARAQGRPVSGIETLGVTAVALVVPAAFTIIGMFFSAALKRTVYALVASFTVCIGVLCIGTFVLAATVNSFAPRQQVEDSPFMWLNPALLTTYAMQPAHPFFALYLMVGLGCYIVASLVLLRATLAFVAARKEV